MALSRESAKTAMVSMSVLPTRCLEHILNRLPLVNVFRVMCVSREWHAAADAVLYEWSILKIGHVRVHSFDKEDSIIERRDLVGNTVILDVIFSPWTFEYTLTDESAAVVARSLMRMRHLRYLNSSARHPVLDQLVTQNAHSLRILIYPYFVMTPDLSFPLLQRLSANRSAKVIDAVEGPAAMLNFKYLHVRNGSAVVLRADPEKMIDLSLTCRRVPDYSTLVSLVQAMLKMHQLEKLSVYLRLPNQEPLPLLQLFSGFTKLTSFQMTFRREMNADLDEAVADLANMNPNLERVSVSRGGRVTDKSLHHLAQLQHLTSLLLQATVSSFTTEGVLALLHGRSRATLKEVYLEPNMPSSVDVLQVEQEITRMAVETGKNVLKARLANRLLDVILKAN